MTTALTSPPDRFMTVKSLIATFTQQEDLNFLLTNRIPARGADPVHGRLQQDREPAGAGPLDRLLEAVLRPRSVGGEEDPLQEPARLLHPGAEAGPAAVRSGPERASRARRTPSSAPTAPSATASSTRSRARPTHCSISSTIPRWSSSTATASSSRLRLTSSMYHRFHAPHDCHIERVTLIHGDTWNVNPIALKRIERLFCKNERAVIRTRLKSGEAFTLVPVAAILVASIRLHFLDLLLNARHAGAHRVSLRRRRAQGRRTRLVRARLDHHPARACAFRVLRRCEGGRPHSRGPAFAEERLSGIAISP